MSNSSSWPPQLKAWVQECLAKATPSNKVAVSAELKEILFNAHKNSTINTTDWSKVQLNALRAQTARTTYVPPPAPPVQVFPPPPPPSAYTPAYHTPVDHYSAIAPSVTISVKPSPLADRLDAYQEPTPSKKAKKEKNKKNKEAAKTTNGKKDQFPSAYHFTSSSADAEALAKRAARFAGSAPSGSGSNGSTAGPSSRPQGVNGWFPPGYDEDDDDVDEYLYGYGANGMIKRIKKEVEVDPNVIDWDRYTIKGTNTKLEKSYLRLTSEPSPADIRPLHVLKQTLSLLKRKWKENHNYPYALDQFKSMRQDLTVQRIKNDFTVEVYEIHARIALEAKDLGEYNQCQTMLRQLYELGISGHPLEFLSYRIIYLLHTRNRSDMASLLAQLTPAEKQDVGIHHALQVAASVATSNYARFFRLYTTAPNMSGYIMDHFIERERMSALVIMTKAYMTLALPYLTSLLAFDSDQETDDFLHGHHIGHYTESSIAANPRSISARVWDCKKSLAGAKAGMEKYRVVDLKGQVD